MVHLLHRLLRVFVLAFLLPSIFAHVQAASSPEVSKGLRWLQAQVQSGGSLAGEAGSVAAPLPARSETLLTLKLLASVPPVLTAAISADTPINTELLARQAFALKIAGQNVDAITSMLIARQNADGGFGSDIGFMSNPLDTVWSLLALVQNNQMNSAAAASARGYITSAVQSDGGIAGVSDADRVQTSALALLALQPSQADLSIATIVLKLSTWLQQRQGADGSWLGDIYLSSEVCSALSPLISDAAVRSTAAGFVSSRQAGDGSWAEDPFLSAIALRALSMLSAPPSAPSGTLYGHVFDANSGTALSTARIAITGPVGRVQQSTVDGRFAFSDLSAGTYALQISSPGYQPFSASYSLLAGQSVNVGAIALQPVSSSGIVRGHIVEGVSNTPLAGVFVALNTGSNTQTDASGNFSLAGVPAGAVTLTASLAGYSSLTGKGTVVAGQTLVFSSTMYANGQTPVTGTHYLGKVVVAGQTTPLAGVSVQVTGSAGTTSAITNAAGQFDIAMAAGSYTATFAMAGYGRATQTFVASDGSIVDAGVVGLAPVRSVSSIKGRVLNASGVGIAGATVQVIGTSPVATTATDGSYSINNIAQTTFSIRASATGYNSQTMNLHLSGPTDVQQDFTLAQQDTSTLVIGPVTVTPPSVGRATDVTATVVIINTSTSDASAVVQLQVRDQSQAIVGKGTVHDAGGNLLGQLTLAAGQQQALRLVWNSAQNPPGAYTLDVRLLQAGSVTQNTPFGVLLTERAAGVSVFAQPHFTGTIVANPPVLQAGTNTAVHLSAVIQNDGNANFDAQALTLTAINTKDGSVVHTEQITASAFATNTLQTLTFQDWTPASGGDFRLELVAGDLGLGKVIGSLYIGDAARASYTTNKLVVATGTQTVRATIQVKGQDVTGGTISDPVAPLIKTAIQKATRFNYVTAASETIADHCTRCHVQAQALVSGELTRKLTNYDSYATYREIILNSLTTHQQSDGAIDGHPSLGSFKRDQSEFAIWALNTWHNPSEIASTLAKLAKYLANTQNSDGTWSADHSGWWTSPVPHASLNIKGLTDAAKTVGSLPSGSAVNSVLTPVVALNSAYHLSSDAAGNVYASNYADGIVQMIKPDGTSQQYLAGLSHPTALVFAGDGTAYVSSLGGLFRRNADGSTTRISTRSGSGLAIGQDGNFYMSSYWDNKISKITPAGVESDYIVGGVLGNPWGIAFTPAGDLLVANYGRQNIVRYHADLSSDIPVGWTNAGALSLQMTSTGWMVTTDSGLYFYNSDWHGERLLYTPMGGVTQTPDGKLYVGSISENAVSKLTHVKIDTGALLTNMDTAIGRTTNWLLQDANTDSNNNLFVAQRLIGLNAAKLYYQGKPLADTLQAKMGTVAAQLRSQVYADGGWGYTVGQASDSMVTAQVGVALDALNPSAADPIVQNAVKLLLSRQRADGTWYSENNIMGTPLAATTWVAIWLPIVLDRLGGIDTDLSVTFAANVKMTNPDLAPASTTVNSDGTTTTLWKMTGVTSGGRDVNYDLTLLDMALNEVRPVSTDAHLTFLNSFTQGVVVAPLDVPRVTGSDFLGLGVTTDRISYSADTQVKIVGQVNNTGVAVSNGSVKFDIYASDNTLVARVGSVPYSGLAAGASTHVAISWNTARTLAGADYYVLGSLYDGSNRFVGSAKANFAIQASQSQSNSAVVTTDRASYSAAQTVQLTARLANLTANAVQNKLVARTSVLGFDGKTVFDQSEGIVQLVPGALRQYNYNIPAASLAVGNYRTKLQLFDAQGILLAQSEGAFVVQSSAQNGVGLTGTLQLTPASTEAGNTIVISATALNQGNADLTNAGLRVSIVDPRNDKVMASWPYTANLARGKPFSINARWKAVTSTSVSTYIAVLQATINGSDLTLATANLVVKVPSVVVPPVDPTPPGDTTPIKLDGRRTLRQGRLLVLLTCRNAETSYSEQSNNTLRDGGPGDDDEPCNASRAKFLNALLGSAAVPHFVTSNVDDFTYAMRSGQYNIYWISGGANKLPQSLVMEVREAVNRGDGLLLDGIHDERTQLLDEVVGMQYAGPLQAVNEPIVFTMTTLNGAKLPTVGRALKLNQSNGISAAEFSPDIVCRGSQEGEDKEQSGCNAKPAAGIAGYVYGRGKSVSMAFDFVGSLQKHGSDRNWATAGLLALDFLTPEPTEAYTSAAYTSVRLTGMNKGSAVNLNVVYTLPPGGKVLASEPNATISDDRQRAQWNLSLPAEQSVDLTLYLRLPRSSGRYTLGTTVGRVEGWQSSPYGSYPLDLQVVAASEAAATSKLIADLQALDLGSAGSQARDQAVEALRSAIAHSSADQAIQHLLDAIDKLRAIPDDASVIKANISACRFQIDRWMQELALEWHIAQAPRNIP